MLKVLRESEVCSSFRVLLGSETNFTCAASIVKEGYGIRFDKETALGRNSATWKVRLATAGSSSESDSPK
jgi:hypothetical protein